jgi:NADH-quinone oxidoreductase subunit C
MEATTETIGKQITAHFSDALEKKFPYNRVDFIVKKETIPSILFYLKEKMGFIHLSHITCVDWLEENEFEVLFIVWSPEQKVKVFVRTRLDRDNPVMENVDMIWRQANTYERELREMYRA